MSNLIARAQSYLKKDYPDLLRILRLVRVEIHLAMVSFATMLSLRQRSVRRQLQSSCDLKVQLGSGPNPVPGWLNIDGGFDADLRVDLRRALPLGSGTVAYIFTEHFLDHLEYPNAIHSVLSECHRVLKPGGIMRVVVHDGERLLRAYLEKDVEFFREIGAFEKTADSAQSLMAAVNHLFRFNGFHQFIYDYETLEREFLKAGFSSVLRSTIKGSDTQELNLDLDLPDRAPQSLYVEAVK
jgi:predicted SAM-dependent methyltransferase